MTLNVVEGDIVEWTGHVPILPVYQVILCHQCNIVSTSPKGIARALFLKYPAADTYTSCIAEKREMGRVDLIKISTSTSPPIRIANMYAQIRPSGAGTINDSIEDRIVAFKSCLDKLADWIAHKVVVTSRSEDILVVFPYNIGCGLAGGDWKIYSRMIQDFTLSLLPLKMVKVILVKKVDV